MACVSKETLQNFNLLVIEVDGYLTGGIIKYPQAFEFHAGFLVGSQKFWPVSEHYKYSSLNLPKPGASRMTQW